MENKRKSQIDIFKKLKAIEKPYFTIADFEKIFGLKKASLYVALNRLVKNGILRRLKRGVYEVVFSEAKIEEVANQLYWPSYLSFESALSRYGIMDQIPYTLTFATPKKSKKIALGGIEVEYKQVKKDLFFGYRKENKILIAEPEKALLDQIYLFSLGKASVNFEEWNFSQFKKQKLLNFSKPYPTRTKTLVKKIKKYLPK